MEIKRLREKGHRITLLNETQFWRLAIPRQSSGEASPKLEIRRPSLRSTAIQRASAGKREGR